MTQKINVPLLELLSSKICHDIISPVGAIMNGVEILEETGSDAGDEVAHLISFSATQAASKLKALRMAYGVGGSDPSITFEDVHTLFEDFIAGDKRLSQDWNPHDDFGMESCDGLSKMLLCCLKLASEALPRGGVVSVKTGEDGCIQITAEGDNAHFRDNVLSALENTIPVDALDPTLVHAYVTGLLSEHYKFLITADKTQDNLISLLLRHSVVY